MDIVKTITPSSYDFDSFGKPLMIRGALRWFCNVQVIGENFIEY
jgi:hypothetical protein